ncbi:MAG: phosphonate C-P lyase system protein PhnL [Phenylobacterium sp.]|jgi:alpha-D-ribose 1-methylphosphonate 5-triphosphate synthase subunit PhnL|uniref:phosphonate C-P lyase system protein PhnL n=1 Tax=Phenylobacterium sp. TaxID=1871053 RepID=UPI002A358D33|nr:phosphonate C-P lyase system protein PhnL [Phenylobacterium sp.]MDX9998120.1 phosphonate C-P lyase system protein PhnL [Phenylobacterium sp.]
MSALSPPSIVVEDLAKTFVLHNADSATIPVFHNLRLEVRPGECVVLAGESGVGKSTLMRSIYGNYLPTDGGVRVMHDGAYVDITRAAPHEVLEVRRRTLGYVSQFLRVIPRIPTLQLVMEPLLENGVDCDEARRRATELLSALRLPEAHWELPPATFSGGEQQRVNIARSFIRKYPVLLLDEPTASLDAENRAIVVQLIKSALAEGAAMIGIFHDEDVRDAVATRLFPVSQFKAAA